MPSAETAPAVSVIVCAYNAERRIAETVDSVLAQTFSDFELIVLDDGSKDKTGEVVRGFAAKDARVRYHYQANAGFGAARNKCLELSRAPWIAIIDHDDVCLPRRLERQLTAAREHPEAALIFSNSEHFTDEGRVVARNFDPFNPCASDLSKGRAAELLLTRGCFIDSETAFFKRAEALACGGFPAHYRYINDYDFFLRLGVRYPIFGVDEVLARWRVHEGQLSHTAKDTIIREHIALLRQWRDNPQLSASARRIVSLKLAAYMARATARPALRREFGTAALVAGAAGALPAAILEPAWLIGKLADRLS